MISFYRNIDANVQYKDKLKLLLIIKTSLQHLLIKRNNWINYYENKKVMKNLIFHHCKEHSYWIIKTFQILRFIQKI